MKNWWQRRSLKLRLALWFTLVASAILLGSTPVVYALIEHRLHIEFDRQLQTDWDLVAAHLESDPVGQIRWRLENASVTDGLVQAGLRFEVWSDKAHLKLRHWPLPIGSENQSLPAPTEGDRSFHTFEPMVGSEVRAMEKTTRLGDTRVTLRVFRDESALHRTLREILIGFALGVPLAAVLSAVGGYLMAGRMLRPVSAMAEQARQINLESLGRRLPNPNPHDELGQMASVFNETLQRLHSSFETLQRFTADASHELRTPLTALRSVGEVALREADNATALRETIGSMLEEAQRLTDLIDSLLFLARVESGRSPLHLERFSFPKLLEEVRESVDVLAAEKQQTVKVNGNVDLMVSADPLLTRQAIMNILDNAIRYSLPGTTIYMRCFHCDGSVIAEISDEGPGIAPDHQQRIFERFFRIDKARSRNDGGAGLGLAIAKLSIERQGGRIELESAVGKGSHFRIILPAG